MANTLLEYDCKTGVNGFTGEPMPSAVRNVPPIMFGLFRIQAIRFARGAFGDEFASAVEQVYDDVNARSAKK